MKILAIALNTFREAIRNKILYSVIFFAAILLLISALFGSVSIGDKIKVIKDFGLFSLSFCGAIITIISGTSLLNKELKQKTVYNILSKPVSREQFILGKYLGLVLTTTLLVGLMGIGLIIFTALMSQKVDYTLFEGIYMALLEMVIIAAVVMFFSSLVVTITLSGMFTLATYIAGRSIHYFKEFTSGGEFNNPGLDAIISIFDKILPDLSRLNYADYIVHQIQITPTQFFYATTYTFCYTIVTLILAMIIFRLRELI